MMYHLIYSSAVLRHDDLLFLLLENEVKINERSRQENILDLFFDDDNALRIRFYSKSPH